MATCASCGTPMPDHATFCPACGAPRAVASPPAPARPVGRTQSPGLVIVLTIVTFGIYGLFYWWRVSKEVDAFRATPDHAHGRVRLGLILLLAGMAALGVGSVAFFGAAVASATSNGAPNAGGAAGTAAGLGFAVLLFVAALGLALAATILLYVGYWRVWTGIREDEVARRVESPLRPGLMLAFALVPYVNLVTLWIAIYRTQKGLNGMWSAQAGLMPDASQPRSG